MLTLLSNKVKLQVGEYVFMYIMLLVIMLMTTYECCLLDFLIYSGVKEGEKN